MQSLSLGWSRGGRPVLLDYAKLCEYKETGGTTTTPLTLS